METLGNGNLKSAKFSAECDWPRCELRLHPPLLDQGQRTLPRQFSSRLVLETSSTFVLISPPRNCNSLQLFSFGSRHTPTPHKMFRNALRQSTRAVGALSASSRVAVVSPHPPARHELNSVASRPKPSSMASRDVPEAQLSFLPAMRDCLVVVWSLSRSCRILLMFWRWLSGIRLTTSSAAKCRTHRFRPPEPHIRRGQGIADRGVVHSRAENSRCPGGVQPR
jgi:hypothetical protein